jgi:uncharacterized protein (UPF0248 family)
MKSKDSMRKSHQILLKFRFDQRYVFDLVRVCYVNRGVPGDHSWVEGNRILTLGPYFMKIATGMGFTCIPYHQIRQIRYNNTVVWER